VVREVHQELEPLEELIVLTKRAKGNIDYIQGVVFPSQTYAFSGRQWGASQEAEAGKMATDASPMIITSQPPGAFAKNDSNWSLTFGASHDAMFTLFNSALMANNPASLNEGDAYGKGAGVARDFNLFRLADDIQQISYVVNGTTVEGFRNNPKILNENTARSIGMRMPQMVAGWGKTIGLRPTDPEPEDDRKNDESHKLARETWKHGPLDMRWDSRRGMWTTYNDLITGNQKENLNTLVFGTNPDENEGFPFLKGYLDDVWHVRKTFAQAGVVGKDSDHEKSGEVLTKLEHRLYDEATQAVGALNTVFTIPGATHGDCHADPLGPTTCGNETTYDGSAVDILTTVHFNMPQTTKDGPLNFTIVDIPNEGFCNPAAGFYHQGTIYFNEEGCVWDVAVKIDECELAGGHLANLASNDVAITERMTYFCNFITNWAGGGGAVVAHPYGYSAPEAHDINFGQVAAAELCLMANVRIANLNAIQNAKNYTDLGVGAAFDYTDLVATAIIAAVNAWITGSLVPALIACCGEGGAGVGTVAYQGPGQTIAGSVAIVPPEYLDCELFIIPMPRLNCEYCFGVHLDVPCGETPNVFAGDACFTNEPPTPTTIFGNCQAHA
jgi:hypothetical protein